ncbi:MAG: hypothetical protein FWC65_04800 [Treponema sp.]|nr:hypothetical protein [Treponema sp.]
MKKIVRAFLLALCAVLFSACEFISLSSFDSRLQGTWVTTNHASVLHHTPGTFEIGFNTITIYNYEPIIGVFLPTPPYLPFPMMPRGSPFSGYSENNRIMITVVPGLISYNVAYVFTRGTGNVPDTLALAFAPNAIEILVRQ